MHHGFDVLSGRGIYKINSKELKETWTKYFMISTLVTMIDTGGSIAV